LLKAAQYIDSCIKTFQHKKNTWLNFAYIIVKFQDIYFNFMAKVKISGN